MREIKPPRPEDFSSRLRAPEVTSRVGIALGVCFFLAFVTGLVSHAAQDTPAWLTFPTRPVSFYRITQGIHVISGTVAIPLLLVKLWTVFPHLFRRLEVRKPRVLALQTLERGSIAILVAAAIFELSTGLANSAQWYPWSFHFRATHYAVAWVAIGALLIHIAVKLPVVSAAITGPLDEDPKATASTSALSRRAFLRTTWLAAGVVGLATAGSTVPWLRSVSVLGVRSGGGPQGIPINKTALAADVTALASSPDYRLRVINGSHTVSLSRTQLEQLPQTTATLPIACVEGWSASAQWRGVRVSDLLALVDAPAGVDIEVTSLQPTGNYRVTELPAQFAQDPLTLLAIKINGERLSIDHGYPCRLIAPNRPGVLQTKWVARIEVLQ